MAGRADAAPACCRRAPSAMTTSVACYQCFPARGSCHACARFDALGKIFEPVPKQRGRRDANRKIGTKRQKWQLDTQRYPSFGARPLLVVDELVFGVGIEIVHRKCRKDIALA